MQASWDDEYLTVSEIAERLRLNQQTVRNWIDQGKLPAVRVGRRVRVRRVDLERVLAQGRTQPDTLGTATEKLADGTANPAPAPVDPPAPFDPRAELTAAHARARRLLGRRSAVRRAELAEGLQDLADTVALALRALPGQANGPSDGNG